MAHIIPYVVLCTHAILNRDEKKTKHQNIETGENKFTRRKYSTNSRCVDYIVVVAFFINGHNSDYHVERGYLRASQLNCTLSSHSIEFFNPPPLLGGHLHMYLSKLPLGETWKKMNDKLNRLSGRGANETNGER